MKHLLIQMTKRDILARYRGSFLGILWSFITPLLMLAVYTFVFSVVFKTRWSGTEMGESVKTANFAITLFCGLVIHTFFAESLAKAPTLIVGNINFVKKIVFPIEILPVISLLSSIFNLMMGVLVLFFAHLFLVGIPPITALLIPIILLPLAMFTLGISWILASIGVFLRDIGQIIGLIMMILLFVSPIFYPIQALPIDFQIFAYFNPLTLPIEEFRNLFLWGKMPNFWSLGVFYVISIVLMIIGRWFFNRTKSAFADVL